MTIKEMIANATMDELIAMEQVIQARKVQLNPFSNLKSLSNKAFGEKWSESYIRSHVPNLSKNNGAGHDMSGIHYQRIEAKASRLTFKDNWTMNQIHPDDADAFLFTWYDCEKGTQEICFIPTKDLITKCTLSRQHVREGKACCTVSSTIHNREILRQYMISSWEALNEVV